MLHLKAHIYVLPIHFARLTQLEDELFHMNSSLRGCHAGGDNETRTRDLLRARQALSQLSYIPIGFGQDLED